MLHNEKSHLINSLSDQQTKLLLLSLEEEERRAAVGKGVGRGGQGTAADLCGRCRGQRACGGMQKHERTRSLAGTGE